MKKNKSVKHSIKEILLPFLTVVEVLKPVELVKPPLVKKKVLAIKRIKKIIIEHSFQ